MTQSTVMTRRNRSPPLALLAPEPRDHYVEVIQFSEVLNKLRRSSNVRLPLLLPIVESVPGPRLHQPRQQV
jgi:hypothetical protein